jgi:hypothetical protein
MDIYFALAVPALFFSCCRHFLLGLALKNGSKIIKTGVFLSLWAC